MSRRRQKIAVMGVVYVCATLGLSASRMLCDTVFAAPKAADAKSADTKIPTVEGVPQVDFINEQIRQVWTDNELVPSAAASDGEWCRRVFLDVIGRIPSVTEMRNFVSDKDPQKRAKLVDRLLNDEEYTEEYARNWTTIWTNVLIGRNGGNEQRSLTSRAGLQKYLRDSFARNKPYDVMVRELVTATGSTTPGSEGFNGAVNFLVMKVNEEKGTLATAETAKVFLGLQVQCTQCHNHPFNDWKQQKFWDMNAFFRQTRALRRFVEGSREIESAELVDEDFSGEGSDPSEAEIYYELRNGLVKTAYPVFVDGTEIPRSGFVSEVNRREQLGNLIVRSTFMEKAVVNRTWAHFFGYGFTKPIDDLGAHNPVTHPALLDYLGKELRTNSFNLKELMRWITLSEPYALSSRAGADSAKDDPLLGETPKFSRFYLRQMRAEELYESLLVATEAHKARGSYEEQEKAKNSWLGQFVIAFGNDEGAESTTFNGTIPQALMMFNGELVKQATSLDKGSFLARIVADNSLKPDQKIKYLFQAGLGRMPNNSEFTAANVLMQRRGGNAAAALQDIWWAVLNSNEFILNH